MTEQQPEAPAGSCGWCRDPYCTGDHSGDAETAFTGTGSLDTAQALPSALVKAQERARGAEAERDEARAKLSAIREYRALVDEDGEQVILIGPCAESIGCLFHRNYDSPTLGRLIDAATEHEGEQGKAAHAHVAEMAADWDAYAAKRNSEEAGHA